jgi:hypothetical protein
MWRGKHQQFSFDPQAQRSSYGARVRIFIFLILVFMSCRTHPLQDGPYVLNVTEVLRDECDLKSTGVLSKGTLATFGNQVRFKLEGQAGTMQGTYLSGIEDLTMDGTATNFIASVRGAQCTLDSAAFHIDAQTLSATTFSGTASVTYVAMKPDSCNCKYWFKFQASR